MVIIALIRPLYCLLSSSTFSLCGKIVQVRPFYFTFSLRMVFSVLYFYSFHCLSMTYRTGIGQDFPVEDLYHSVKLNNPVLICISLRFIALTSAISK